MKKSLIIAAICIATPFFLMAQTIGNTIYSEGNQDGYVLFAPLNGKSTYLIDKCGRKVQEWNSTYLPGAACKLGKDGKLYRTGSVHNTTFLNGGGNGGVLEIFSFNGQKEATYLFSDEKQVQHHDIFLMDNGNILLTLWQLKGKEDCLNVGKDISQMDQISQGVMWFEKVIEVKPIDSTKYDIVWSWEAFDHLVQDYNVKLSNYDTIRNAPHKIDINYNPNDNPQTNFIHFNSIDYNAETDQILLSARLFDEVWIIDHSTTTKEAATDKGGNSGQGGSLLYRWGNPYAYKTGDLADRKLFKQHNAHWVKNNETHNENIMIFNNGNGREPVNFSSVEIIKPPKKGSSYVKGVSTAFGPATAYYEYTDTANYYFFASYISGATFLDNGNLFISDGPAGRSVEVNDKKNVVWEYINPLSQNVVLDQGEDGENNPVFRFEFYNEDFSGFKNQTLEPGKVIELNSKEPMLCEKFISIKDIPTNLKVVVYPNPSNGEINIMYPIKAETNNVEIYNSNGQIVHSIELLESNTTLQLEHLQRGMYFLKIGENHVKLVLQ